jgi:hypothetical protein
MKITADDEKLLVGGFAGRLELISSTNGELIIDLVEFIPVLSEQ